MTTHNDPVLTAALALSPEDRGKLADRLLETLRFDDAETIDPREAENRLNALRRGDPASLETE